MSNENGALLHTNFIRKLVSRNIDMNYSRGEFQLCFPMALNFTQTIEQ